MWCDRRFVLLSILAAAFFMKVKCQSLNTPPTIWLDSRDWQLSENETVGTRITQAHGYSHDSNSVLYNLEHIELHPTKPLPFRINPNTGVVYLNESLNGRAGENIRLYIRVFDGKSDAKSEVNVNILDEKQIAKPSKFNHHPPFSGQTPAFLNYPGMFPKPGPPRPPPPPPSQMKPYFQEKIYQEPVIRPKPNETTQLRPVKIETTSRKFEEKPTTTEKSIKESSKNDLEPKPIQNKNDFSAAIIPIASVIVVFLTLGIIALLFRKRIYLGKRQQSKDDMIKESSGNVLSDNGLSLHEWIGPRAFSNRYEPWQSDPNYTQSEIQTSSNVKNGDRWEFPRHRLKFFNIIGEGAFGQVWKCEALDINGKDSGVSVVAVKTLKENAHEKERSDLLSELQVMKTLEPHQNVVRLLGCCTDKEPIFLIMEYISKGKLQTYLRNSRAERYYNNMHGKSKCLTSKDLTSFAYQVAKGMEFLSNNGIIHRDLAARNVLISDEHICKVADFGFARDVATSHVYERKSEGRLPIRWMAPESLFDNLFSSKSDVWSFGILIWEVVTLGSTPYPGMSAAEVMKKIKNGYRLDKPEHCRRELYNIMYYCWDKDPKQRPTFAECIELLENLLMTETDYIELERFPDHSYYNIMSLSGEKL